MMAYPIYQIIVSISAAGIPVAISIMIAEKLANDDMRGVQQVFSVSLRVLAILGLVFSLALYGSAQWLVDNQIITDPRALIAIQLLSPAIFVVTILSCFRGYFQGFQYMVPTGTSQVFEQIFRVSSMVGLAYYFIDRGLTFGGRWCDLCYIPRRIGRVTGINLFLLPTTQCSREDAFTTES